MKNLKPIFLVALLGLTSCAHVRQEDLDAWRGANFSELESHPVYSVMELKKTELSTGGTLYDYVNSGTVTDSTNCYTNNGYTSCYGGGTQVVSCHHQFFVKNNIIEQYRPIGQCYTNCSRRPASKPCQ